MDNPYYMTIYYMIDVCMTSHVKSQSLYSAPMDTVVSKQ